MDHKRLCSIFLLLATVKKFTLAHECGNVLFSRGLVVKGTAVSPGQWPFLVALKHAELNSFFCGGNLISSTHVLTGEISFFQFFKGVFSFDITHMKKGGNLHCETKCRIQMN